MSKIGKKPIQIPQNVKTIISEKEIECVGSLGAVKISRLPFVSVTEKDGWISFSPDNNSKQARANWGTLRALAQNSILGVTKGFKKVLIIEGVGYRAAMEGETVVLHLGFSHPVRFEPPSGITIAVVRNTILVSGVDNALVGQTAAKIRALKKPEPYKGKGIRYENEVVKRKAGKKTAGTAK